MDVKDMISEDEGYRQRPYLDCCGKYWRDCSCQKKGKLTVGMGRNLDDVGISEEEARALRDNDVSRVVDALNRSFPWFTHLSDARRSALTDMAFNLGVGGLLEFKQMLAALEEGQYEEAAKQMLMSHWALQVGDRAKRISEMMRTG